MTNSAQAGIGKPQPSRKLIHEWHGDTTVAIWDDCSWTVRLYEDRAIIEWPVLKDGEYNSQYVGTYKCRVYPGSTLNELKRRASPTYEPDGSDDPDDEPEESVEWLIRRYVERGGD